MPKIALAAGIGLLVMVATICAWFYAQNEASKFDPNPTVNMVVEDESDGFPVVDWQYWHEINPDVIAWITVPGTTINYPIVQAHSDSRTWYLKHDIYGNYNWRGVPYLDADCSLEDLSLNNVIFGHHSKTGEPMFRDFSLMTDPVYAEQHHEILLQTPSRKMRLEVQASEMVPGWDMAKRTSFEGEADFTSWWLDTYEGADMKRGQEYRDLDISDMHIFSFVTCSYNRWSNERTVTYAVDVTELKAIKTYQYQGNLS